MYFGDDLEGKSFSEVSYLVSTIFWLMLISLGIRTHLYEGTEVESESNYDPKYEYISVFSIEYEYIYPLEDVYISPYLVVDI